MAVTEKSILMRNKDASNNATLLYPITKKDNVDGLNELVRNQSITTSGESKDAVGTLAYKLDAPKVFATGSTPINTGFKPLAAGTTTWTIAVKYKDGIEALNSDQWGTLIYADADSTAGSMARFIVATNDSTTKYPNCGIFCGNYGFALNVTDVGQVGSNPALYSGYHTFIVTRSGDNYTFYLDNIKIFNCALTYPQDKTGDAELYVGGWGSGWGMIKGTIMDVRVYDTCLTDSSVTRLNNIFAQDSTGCTSYQATVEGITSLTAGVSFVMVPHAASGSTAATLNVNSLGAKQIRRRVSSSTGTTSAGQTDDWLAAGKPVRVTYDGLFWIADLPRTNATDLMGTVAVANGGTGASTAAAARTNLGLNCYAVCETDGATATKVVSCSGFTLTTGAEITVLFQNENTASDCKLKVNDSDAYSIVYKGITVGASGSTGCIATNGCYKFVFDGTVFSGCWNLGHEVHCDLEFCWWRHSYY